MRHKKTMRWMTLVLAGVLLLSGCAGDGQPQQPSENPLGNDLVCLEFNRYTGFVGGRQVSNVAAILVANRSDAFLEYATIQCDVGSRRGTFRVEGLAPGRSCWVLEQDHLRLNDGERIVAVGCDDYAFNPNTLMATDKIEVSIQGSTISVTNRSGRKLTNVTVFFKNLYGEGIFFGGETYAVTFSALESGHTASKQHAYLGNSSQVVKYELQDTQS